MKNYQDTLAKIQSLSKGQTMVYHRGHLPYDRKTSRELEKLATLAYSLATDVKIGEKVVRPATIHLTQKMVGLRGSTCRTTEYRATGA
jgi:hypothetical protein